MKKTLFFTLSFIIGISYFASSQNNFLHIDSRIDSLIYLHKKINSMDSLIPGYRVQIFFESGNFSKSKALETAEEFSKKYPEMRYYLSFDEPYYRIRVGDFRTLIEAKGFLDRIIYTYPSAFEVKDRIYFPTLPE